MGTHFKGRAGEVRALDAFIKLMRASDSLSVFLGRRLQEEQLTENQFGVLEALLHLGPMCQSELGRKLFTSGGNVTLLVDQLEERGLVRRVRAESDRRYVQVQLTDEGRRFIKGLFPCHAAAIARAFSALTAAEQEELGRLCKKLGTRTSEEVQRAANLE